MRIVSSEIAMTAAHQSVVKDQSSEELTVWTDGEEPARQTPRASRHAWGRDRVSLSGKEHHHTRKTHSKDLEEDDDDQLASKDSKLYLMKKLIEALTGVSFHVAVAGDSNDASEGEECDCPAQAAQDTPQNDQSREGWGAVYNSTQTHYESEKLEFNAGGIIKTADGKEIAFSVNLQMSREYLSQQSVSLRAGDATRVDPLVINYSGKAAELTDMKFAFDINSDGNTEDIPFVQSGSGLLALDRNGDGAINNGGRTVRAVDGQRAKGTRLL